MRPLSVLCHFTEMSAALRRRSCVSVFISKKGFRAMSRRYIRLLSLPVSGGKPALLARSPDKQQQRPILHVHTFALVHRWGA